MIESQSIERPIIPEGVVRDIKDKKELFRQLEQIKNATEATEQAPDAKFIDLTEIALSDESVERLTKNILTRYPEEEREQISSDLEKTSENLRKSGEVSALLELLNQNTTDDPKEDRNFVAGMLKEDYPAFEIVHDEVEREKKELGPELEVMRYFIDEVKKTQLDQYLLEGTGVEFYDLNGVRQVCEKIDEQMKGLSTSPDVAIAEINELIANAWKPDKNGEDSPFKKLYIAWQAGIKNEIEEERTRRVEALRKKSQRPKDAPKAEEAAAVEAAKNAEYNENLKREKDALQREEREQKLNLLEGLKKVASVNSAVISELDRTPLGGQLPGLKTPSDIGELDPGNPPDMTREEALIGELKRLTLVMLEMVISEKPTDGTKSEMGRKHNDSIQLPFNHALRQIIDIYKGTISKKDLIEAIKGTVLPKKFSEGTIEKIVVGMIGEVAVQDVAREMYTNECVRDSTIKEDGDGNDFFVKVRVTHKYGRSEVREFGIDVKTGLPRDRVKDNEVYIDPKDINMDTFSIRGQSAVSGVEEQIRKVIEGTDTLITIESLAMQ